MRQAPWCLCCRIRSTGNNRTYLLSSLQRAPLLSAPLGLLCPHRAAQLRTSPPRSVLGPRSAGAPLVASLQDRMRHSTACGSSAAHAYVCGVSALLIACCYSNTPSMSMWHSSDNRAAFQGTSGALQSNVNCVSSVTRAAPLHNADVFPQVPSRSGYPRIPVLTAALRPRTGSQNDV